MLAFHNQNKSQQIITLTPPRLTIEHVKEKIICIRGHRERLFRVATASYHDKVIFHNYGQGGAGWTFLFGCVHESIRLFEQQLAENPQIKNKPICVIGAGCYGLLTASMLARKGHVVRIIAQEIEHCSSYKAAGIFFPRPRKSSTPEETAVFHARGTESYAVYQQILKGNHPFLKKGVTQLPAYYGLDVDPGFGPYIEQGLLRAPEKVTIDFGTGKTHPAMAYTTIFINSVVLMEELYKNIRTLGIPVDKAAIESFDEIPESMIFNCAGFGAKKLADDKRIVPVQGHLLTLQNQPISQLNYIINAKVIQQDPQGRQRDELLYFAPKESGILGITFIRGQESLTANQHEFDRLLERAQSYFGI